MFNKSTTNGKTVFEIIAEKLCAKMDETNLLPWEMPWKKIKSTNENWFISGQTGKEYDFLNALLLMAQGGEYGRYFTFNGAKKMGLAVKKGARGKIIKGSTILERFAKDENGAVRKNTKGEPVKEKIFVQRYWTVFHQNDIQGFEEKKETLPAPVLLHKEEAAEVVANNYLARENIALKRGGNHAFYNIREDFIQLPTDEQFVGKTNEYYSVLFHEMAHSTGHETRLNRRSLIDGGRFTQAGKENYAKDELVAEISAAYLCGLTDTASDKSLTNSAAYIKAWKERIKQDPKALVIAFAQAEKAVGFIMEGAGRKDETETEDEGE